MAISTIKSTSIFDDTITAADIGVSAVGSSELGDLSVDSAAIQTAAVTALKVDRSVATTGRSVAFSMVFGSYQ